jgi:hypothetical protein
MVSDADRNANYVLRDILGKLILSGTMNHSTTLDISAAVAGVYFLTIGTRTQRVLKR